MAVDVFHLPLDVQERVKVEVLKVGSTFLTVKLTSRSSTRPRGRRKPSSTSTLTCERSSPGRAPPPPRHDEDIGEGRGDISRGTTPTCWPRGKCDPGLTAFSQTRQTEDDGDDDE